MGEKGKEIIRPLAMKDIYETTILCHEEFGHLHTELVDFSTSLSDADYGKYFIASIDDEIIGVSGYTMEDYDPSDVAQISWMVVKREFRRRNIGRMLLKTVEKNAKESGKRIVYVYTSRPNAETFYKKSGYILGGQIPKFYKSGKSKTWYYKHLPTPEDKSEDGDA